MCRTSKSIDTSTEQLAICNVKSKRPRRIYYELENCCEEIPIAYVQITACLLLLWACRLQVYLLVCTCTVHPLLEDLLLKGPADVCKNDNIAYLPIYINACSFDTVFVNVSNTKLQNLNPFNTACARGHCLYHLLPPVKIFNNLRQRGHNFMLPDCCNNLQ